MLYGIVGLAFYLTKCKNQARLKPGLGFLGLCDSLCGFNRGEAQPLEANNNRLLLYLVKTHTDPSNSLLFELSMKKAEAHLTVYISSDKISAVKVTNINRIFTDGGMRLVLINVWSF